MRLLILFLLISLGSQAQIIRAQPFYRPLSIQTDLLLDSFPNAAVAYSIRKLSKNYSGFAIRVRRKSDNAEQNIGFLSSNYLDTVSLKNFVGTSSSDTGWVTTWYDQVSTRNATNSIAANQPKIITSGKINYNNSIISLDFTNNSFLSCDSVVNPNQIYFFTVTAPIVGGSSRRYLYGQGGPTNNTGDIALLFNYQASNQLMLTWTNNVLSRSGTYSSNTQLFTTFKTGSTSNWAYGYYINGTASNISYTTSVNSATVRSAAIGRAGTYNSDYYNGYITEIIYYNSNQNTNRTAIHNNINNFYKIY